MTKRAGFLQLRRGVWDHLRDGRLSHMDALAFIYIMSQADTRYGVWNGSASALAGEIVVSPRNARRLLERLTEAQYLKRFPVPGKHVCYPILVHKYPISDGQHKGELLDALNSISPTRLRYMPSKVGEQECEHKGEHRASQKILETLPSGYELQKPPAKPARVADARYQECFSKAYEGFRTKHRVTPTWDGRHGQALRKLLQASPSLSSNEFLRRWQNYLASSDAFVQKQGGSLAYFCAHFDSFLTGPITANSNGHSSQPVAPMSEIHMLTPEELHV